VIDTRLRNRVVLITGVNNPFGVGAATAKAFTAEGAKIFGTYLSLPAKATATDSPGLEFYESQISKPPTEVVDTIRKLGGAVEVVAADLANPEIVPLLFDQAEKAFGPVDVLIKEDVADVILFLASEQARWLTGQMLYVGGGHQMPS
jgi:3-oxoacyl-[acyl-carrier protein] reductase